jgi:actin-related protein
MTTTTAPPRPLHTLVVDNGGDTVKFGWSNGGGDDDEDSSSNKAPPRSIPNVTARLPQQWTVLVGDELSTAVSNPSSLIAVTRSTERGVVTNMGNQIQVWKRVLDLLHVSVTPPATAPHHHTRTAEASQAFGWDKKKAAKKQQQQQTVFHSNTCAVLITVPPHTPRSVLDHTARVWLEDFGFSRVGWCLAQTAAAAAVEPPICQSYGTTLVVDLGWSCTTVVPVVQSQEEDFPVVIRPRAIRRLPVGGRHLINLWKYWCSYRQWNLMDQEAVLRDVLHKTAVVSTDFDRDMETALTTPPGKRPYDRQFVLPDYQSTFEGRVQLPVALERELEEKKAEEEAAKKAEEEDELDDDYEPDAQMEEDDDDYDNAKEEDVVDSEEEEESPEEKRRRLLEQRKQEEQLRRQKEAEEQVLNLSVERFCVPEVLFRPTDAGLPSEWANLPQTIVQSIAACPDVFRGGLYRSILLTGGLSQLPHLQERLLTELRALAPTQYEVHISSAPSPIEQAWLGAQKLATTSPCQNWSVSREEWESVSKRGVWTHLLQTNGGYIV